MTNDLDALIRECLNAQADWRIISPFITPDVQPVAARDHVDWLKGHEHSHSHVEIQFVLRGRRTVSLNHQVYPSFPGCVFVFDENTVHDAKYPPKSSGDSLDLWIYAFDEIFWASLLWTERGRLKPIDRRVFAASGLEMSTYVRGPTRLLRASSESDEVKRRALVNVLSWLLFALLASNAKDASSLDRSERQALIMAGVQAHIETSIDDDLSVDALAAMTGYSKYHFIRTFRKHVGLTPLECVNETRKAKVMKWRKEGLLDKEMAARLGFSSHTAFSLWLKKHGLRKA